MSAVSATGNKPRACRHPPVILSLTCHRRQAHVVFVGGGGGVEHRALHVLVGRRGGGHRMRQRALPAAGAAAAGCGGAHPALGSREREAVRAHGGARRTAAVASGGGGGAPPRRSPRHHTGRSPDECGPRPKAQGWRRCAALGQRRTQGCCDRQHSSKRSAGTTSCDRREGQCCEGLRWAIAAKEDTARAACWDTAAVGASGGLPALPALCTRCTCIRGTQGAPPPHSSAPPHRAAAGGPQQRCSPSRHSGPVPLAGPEASRPVGTPSFGRPESPPSLPGPNDGVCVISRPAVSSTLQ